MKNYLQINLFLFAFVFVLSGAAQIFGQTQIPVVGGYQKIEATGAKAIAAANFAVKAEAKKQKSKIKIVSVNEVERQVVAGTNYRLCLKIEVIGKDKNTISQIVQAVVYQNLKRKMSLTSWEESDCFKDVPEPPND